MIKVDLKNSSVIRGIALSVLVSHPRISDFAQIQMEIFDTGVANPSAKLGFGTEPRRCGDNAAEVQIESKNLECGIYEIRLIRLHTPRGDGQEHQLDFIFSRDFSRVLFEVIKPGEEGRDSNDLLTEIEAREAALEREFNAPVEICQSGDSTKFDFTVLVFVRDVLIGTRIRFKNFELLPTEGGLDSKDSLDFVNSFIKERTKLELNFPYSEVAKQNSRRSNPVFVVHFPRIVSSTLEQARDFCHQRTNSLILALSLSRDAGGVVFEIVLIKMLNGDATKFSISSPYVGNLLTGNLSGESALSIETYLTGLGNDPTSSFLVGLYKQGRREQNPDYQYIRFWQILEIMAEGQNYDQKIDLLDYEGNVMMDGKHPRKCKGSVNTVFALLMDEGIGKTRTTWEQVNVWFAFRTAVAHHGTIENFTKLSRENVKKWALYGVNEITKTGHDNFLWQLKEDAKLLLMRRLVRNSKNE